MPLKQTLSRHWFRFQRELFPWLEETLGSLGEGYQRLVRVLELVRVEESLPYSRGWRGRPLEDRAALARAFLAKAVLDMPTTRALVERLRTEGLLRRLCGWEAAGGVPSEATFSRAFAEFAASDLPGRLHEESWTGYKLHIDAIDGGIPVSCLLTSASVHDSQAAIPLARLTASRVDSLYDLMDSAYDAPEIRAFSQELGHVPIIDLNPRRRPQVKAERKREALAQHRIGQVSPEARRYRERSTVERVNGRLKDEFGGRHLRVRGPGKVWCHLMFGILALTVEQLMRLTL